MLEDGDIVDSGTAASALTYQINNGDLRAFNGLISGLTAGDEVQFTVSADTITDWNNTHRLLPTGRHNGYGNIMSLNYVDFESATTIRATYAFNILFANNDNIINAENLILPAPTLVGSCYASMFYACHNLISAPELPATTLASSCYDSMFYACTSLTTAPTLPARDTTTGASCYRYMFDRCSNLNYVKCLGETRYAGDTHNWLRDVSATGTFVKSANATWSTGDDGIPVGWDVIDE